MGDIQGKQGDEENSEAKSGAENRLNDYLTTSGI